MSDMEVCPAGTLAELARLREQLAVRNELSEKVPAVWMESTHLSIFENIACGSDSMLARCSYRQLHANYRPLYSTAHLEAYGERKRREGMEEAARICDEFDIYAIRDCSCNDYPRQCATAIRAAIKGEQP